MYAEVSPLSLKCQLRYAPCPIGKWHSSESDVNSMVMSTSEQSSGKALMVDMGAFHLAEFAQTLCLPFVGSAVHGGLHVVQVVSQFLAMRMLMIPALDDTFKVCLSPKTNDHGEAADCECSLHASMYGYLVVRHHSRMVGA